MTFTANYSERIDFLRQAIREADHIIIGAGSGLSTAAGIDYSGEDFRHEFAPWIKRYGFTDLYTSSFHPFETQEEYWAYWAKHIWFSRYRTGATELYKMLFSKFGIQNSTFVVTTNVDGQFEMAGFSVERIFATQGDYHWFQPASGTPKTLIDNQNCVMNVLPLIEDCRIPTEMIPTMPDGSPAAMNLRVDETFVEDFRWHQQARRYTDFVQQASQGNLLFPSSRWRNAFPTQPLSASTATTRSPTSKTSPASPPSPRTSPPSLDSYKRGRLMVVFLRIIPCMLFFSINYQRLSKTFN